MVSAIESIRMELMCVCVGGVGNAGVIQLLSLLLLFIPLTNCHTSAVKNAVLWNCLSMLQYLLGHPCYGDHEGSSMLQYLCA